MREAPFDCVWGDGSCEQGLGGFYRPPVNNNNNMNCPPPVQDANGQWIYPACANPAGEELDVPLPTGTIQYKWKDGSFHTTPELDVTVVTNHLCPVGSVWNDAANACIPTTTNTPITAHNTVNDLLTNLTGLPAKIQQHPIAAVAAVGSIAYLMFGKKGRR